MVNFVPQAVVQTEFANALGDTQITGLSSAKGLADGDGGAIPTGTLAATVTVEAQPVRMRVTGGDPTTTRGVLLNPGDQVRLNGDLTKVRFIETTASASLFVTFLG